MLTLRALQARMLRRDWEDERKPSARSTKQDRLQRFVAAAINEVLTCDALPTALAEELTAVTHKHFLDQLHGLTSLAPTLAQKVHPRSASVVILAELITFSPWTDATTWGPGVRKTELRTAADDLTALRKTDLVTYCPAGYLSERTRTISEQEAPTTNLGAFVSAQQICPGAVDATESGSLSLTLR